MNRLIIGILMILILASSAHSITIDEAKGLNIGDRVYVRIVVSGLVWFDGEGTVEVVNRDVGSVQVKVVRNGVPTSLGGVPYYWISEVIERYEDPYITAMKLELEKLRNENVELKATVARLEDDGSVYNALVEENKTLRARVTTLLGELLSLYNKYR